MDRAQKAKVVEELGQIFESSGVVVVAHYEGMTVAQMQDLRAKMRDVGGSVRVAKNTLAKIALEGKPCESMAKLLTGMTVLAYSEDPVAAAKVAEAYAKTNDKFVILGGAMGKEALDPAVSRLSLPCRRAKSSSLRSCRASGLRLRTSLVPLARLLPTSRASSRLLRSGKPPDATSCLRRDISTLDQPYIRMERKNGRS